MDQNKGILRSGNHLLLKESPLFNQILGEALVLNKMILTLNEKVGLIQSQLLNTCLTKNSVHPRGSMYKACLHRQLLYLEAGLAVFS